jgi:hypothetical protein
MPYHTTEHTMWWYGTGATPPAFGVMVASNTMPPLRIEQWCEIGGVADPGTKPKIAVLPMVYSVLVLDEQDNH